jgi:hypothetical protein
MNSDPLSDADDRDGKASVMSIKGVNTHFWALFFTAAVSVQVLRISATVRVWQKSPCGSPPS